MVFTLKRPRDIWSGISGRRDIDWEFGAFSDGDGWRNIGSETRRSYEKMTMILHSQTLLIRNIRTDAGNEATFSK